MTNLAISDQTFAQLRQAAETQRVATEDLAEQAIREFLRADRRHMMQRELEAFRHMHVELLNQYSGQYVAICAGQVVDHDADQLGLCLRIDQKFPERPVLIKQVLPQLEESYTIRSPRLENEP